MEVNAEEELCCLALTQNLDGNAVQANATSALDVLFNQACPSPVALTHTSKVSTHLIPHAHSCTHDLVTLSVAGKVGQGVI